MSQANISHHPPLTHTHTLFLSYCPSCHFFSISFLRNYTWQLFHIHVGHINLTWNLCNMMSLWPFDLQPWNYYFELETFICNCIIFLGHIKPNRKCTPVVILTFWPLKLNHENLAYAYCWETIHGNCFIFSGAINLILNQWDRSFWPFDQILKLWPLSCLQISCPALHMGTQW